MPIAAHATSSPPPRFGTVYGCLLNFRDALDALGEAVHQAPYKAPPKAPILYIKPRNTIAADGDAVFVPAGIEALEMGASLGLVIGRTACRVDAARALEFVSGMVAVNDISVPHASYYRPSMRFKCRDGFCPIGSVVPVESIDDPGALTLCVEIDGVERQRRDLSGLIRPIGRLIAEVSEFMTLHPGDVLMIGVPGGAPQARAGQHVTVAIEGVGRVHNTLVAEVPA